MSTVPTVLARRRHPTPYGQLTLLASDDGLRAVLWPDVGHKTPVHDRIEDAPSHPFLTAAVRQLDDYVVGSRRDLDLPLDLRGTEFQLVVWQALRGIPYGETVTYGDIARGIGRPRAARAVGAAVGRNPTPIVLPCHRVIGSDGSLTGFGGGLDVKRRLLDHEHRIASRS